MTTQSQHARLLCLMALLMSIALSPASALAQSTQPATQPDSSKHPAMLNKERAARLGEALKSLVAEAMEIDDFDKPKASPRWSRPHPALAGFGSDMAMECLNRMLQPFAGTGPGAEFRDTYVRWHLMWVVNKASQDDRRKMGTRLVSLINSLPGALHAEARRQHWYEPPEIASRYFSLAHSGNMVVGYPPFQRSIGPPESYKYMDANRVAQIQANLIEAAKLKDKFVTKTDPAAIAWNSRISHLNYIIRQYRGELIYALLLTGDPEMARRVMSEIDKQAKQKRGIAFDLLAYVYLAVFDGAMDLYDQRTLNDMSNMLRASAIAMEGYVSYGGTQRNFADYAFHLIYMLQDGGGFIEAKDTEKQPESTGYKPSMP